MINYIIINGTNSNTINGLGINELPPISKPPLRVQTEEIDGRDGDISTNLGYGAYDKTISIGLFGTGYDINEVISFFNGEGTVVFSNEPNKYYKYKIINQIDYEALLKFKSASITFHCQPFKYPLEETPLEIEYEYIEQDNVESATLNNTNGNTHLDISLKGNTSQYTTTGKNLFDYSKVSNITNYLTLNNDVFTYANGAKNSSYVYFNSIALQANTTYSFDAFLVGATQNTKNIIIVLRNTNGDELARIDKKFDTNISLQYTPSSDVNIDRLQFYNVPENPVDGAINFKIQIEKSEAMTSYEPYTNGASPNPDYPQPINVVSGDNEVVVCGKNICNKIELQNSSNIRYYFDKRVQQTITLSTILNVDVLTNSLYLTVDGTSYGNVGNISGTANTRISTTITFSNATFEAIKNSNECYLTLYKSQAGFTLPTNGMIENNNTMTDYEPYQSQTYPIYLGIQNIADFKNINYTTSNNAVVSRNDGEYTITSSSSKWASARFAQTNLNLKPSTTYTFSAKVVSTTSSTGSSVYVYSGGSSTGSAVQGTLAKDGEISYITFTTPSTITSSADILGLIVNAESKEVVFTDIMLELGNTYHRYYPYGKTPIELCKIGDYQDYFTKNSEGQWCKYNAIGKVVLDGSVDEDISSYGTDKVKYLISDFSIYNTYGFCNYFKIETSATSSMTIGEYRFVNTSNKNYILFMTEYGTSASDFKTWLGTHNTIVYGVLKSPYLSLIEDETLKSQLDNIQNALSYEGQTNVSQVNNDKPFLLDLIAMEKGTDEVVINNIGNVYAKPTIALEGTGETDIYLNNTEILKVDLSEKNKITIDTNNMEAYDPTDNSLANRKVIGNYNSMTLPSGNTTMKITGALTKATITDYSRWL